MRVIGEIPWDVCHFHGENGRRLRDILKNLKITANEKWCPNFVVKKMKYQNLRNFIIRNFG